MVHHRNNHPLSDASLPLTPYTTYSTTEGRRRTFHTCICYLPSICLSTVRVCILKSSIDLIGSVFTNLGAGARLASQDPFRYHLYLNSKNPNASCSWPTWTFVAPGTLIHYPLFVIRSFLEILLSGQSSATEEIL